jgi:hypothetical protein
MRRCTHRSRRRKLIARAALGRHAERFSGLEPLDPRVLLAGDVFVTVLHDLNGNGIKDPEEPGLEGWTVFVDLDRNGTLDAGEPSAVSDIDGDAPIVEPLEEGSYDVVQVVPPGWAPAPGYDVVERIDVRDGETTDVLFLNITAANGAIEGTVWNDLNNDGVRDLTDPPLVGWRVFLDLNTNREHDSGEPFDDTDAGGFYQFLDLAPADYRVREITPDAWEPTLGFDRGVTVTVTPGATEVVDFGNFSNASLGAIEGSVWNDVNADGTRAAGDPGMADWTVFLDLDGDDVLDAMEQSALTDPLGFYSFPSVPAGNYRVVLVIQEGWNLSPGHPAAVDVTVVGENTSRVDFATYSLSLGSISGKVWNDLNGDGLPGVAELGVEGWTVFIDQDADGVADAGEPSAMSDAGGQYTLASIPMGAQVVRVAPAIGWRPTAPGTGMQLVNMLNATHMTGINFGSQQRTDSAIGGLVFADSNGNGVRDSGEKGLPGITIYFDLDNNGVLDAGEPWTVTSADLFYTPAVNESGTYQFTHLAGGDYLLRQVVAEMLSSTPAAERQRLITLVPGEERQNVNFADQYRPTEIHGTEFDDLDGDHVRDAGEPGMAGVTVYVDLDRDDVMDDDEPRTVCGEDGSYSFTGLPPGAYVVRDFEPEDHEQTYPTTVGGILWPEGTSNPAVGNVTPTSITTSLALGETFHQTVSLTLPGSGALTNMVDVFLLFDDTGSFTANSPIVRAAFPEIISTLQAALPGINLAFGVGRLEEYANFASEYGAGRPFVLNQPIVASSTAGFATAIQAALDRMAPGYGGDLPETDIEALYQLVTGRGFDGNNNGSVLDSGPAGLVSTQLTPGVSGDVPPFVSFVLDPSGSVLPASGTLGGAGFRAGALPIILAATDDGFAYQPKGETSITGIGGLTLPLAALTEASRPSTPFASGAGIQETITALNALGALVIGLGTNSLATADPRQMLEAIARLTGATNQSAGTIPNGTTDPVAPGDPFYFQIASGFGTSVANGVVAAIQNAVTNVAVNITLKASDPRVHILSVPGVVNGVGAGETATFDVEFTGDGIPHRFDLQFIREGTEVVLGSIPVVLGTPIPGDGYEFEDLDEGEIHHSVDFGSHSISPVTVIQGTTGDDALFLRIDPTQAGVLQVFRSASPSGVLAYTLPLAEVPALTINLLDGNDRIILDFTGGPPVPAGGLFINGGAGAADTLAWLGGPGGPAVSLTSSRLYVADSAIYFSQVEAIEATPGDATNLSLSDSASATLVATAHLGSLTLSEASKLSVATGRALVLRTAALSIDASSALDLSDNDLIFQSAPASRATDLAALSALLASGRNTGALWTGPGIHSSAAANDPAHLTGLAITLNDDGTGSPVRSEFAGEAVDANSILVKHTYDGDANLDGRINISDFFAIDAGFGLGRAGYAHGDFDYSGGLADADDYMRIDRAFLAQGSPLSPPAAQLDSAAGDYPPAGIELFDPAIEESLPRPPGFDFGSAEPDVLNRA